MLFLEMKQIILTPLKDEMKVMVCITDDMRKNERNVFFCPLACIASIIQTNINVKY